MKNIQLVCLLLGVFLLVSSFTPIAWGFTVSRMEEPEDEDIDMEDEDDIIWAMEDEWDTTDWEELMDFDADLIADVIVEDGFVDEDWADEKHTVFTEGRYQAYTTFIVEVDPNMNEQFGPPDVSIIGAKPAPDGEEGQETDILRVELRGDAVFGNFEELLEMFSLRVDYYCKKPGTEELKVSFTVIDSTNEVTNVTFFWKKECGSGNREGFAITQGEDGDEAVVTNGAVESNWSPTVAKHLEPSGSTYTTFYFKIGRNMGSQDYSDPIVSVSDENALRVHPVDDASNGNIVSEATYHQLNIYYSCATPLAEKEITVTLTYKLGSFNPVTFAWRKSCGGDRNPSLVISSQEDKAGDIYKNGKTAEAWLAEQPKIQVFKNYTSTTFYIHSDKDYVRFAKPVLTVQPPGIVKARVVPKPSGEIFSAYSEPSPIVVEYRCLQKGTANIRISVFFSDIHNPINFGWIKECPKYKPKTEVSDPWYLTAWNAFLILMTGTAVIAGVSLWGWTRYVRRRAAEHAARLRARAEEESY